MLRLLLTYVLKPLMAPIRRVYTRLGWHGTSYVHAGGIISTFPVGDVIVDLPLELRDWKLPPPLAIDPARATAAVFLARLDEALAELALPILLALPIARSGGGIHLVGERRDCAALAMLVGQYQGAPSEDSILDRPDTKQELEALLAAAPEHLLALRIPEPTDAADRRRAVALDTVMYHPTPGRAAVITYGGPPPTGDAARAGLTIAVPRGLAESEPFHSLATLAASRDLAGLRATQIAARAARGGADPAWCDAHLIAARRALVACADGQRMPAIAVAMLAGAYGWAEDLVADGVLVPEDGARTRTVALERIAHAVLAGAADAIPAPDVQFLDLLRGVFESGRGHLVDDSGAAPPDPELFGWRYGPGGIWLPQGRQLGWRLGVDIYLTRTELFSAIVAQARATGAPCPISSARALGPFLRDHELLVATESSQQNTAVRKTIDRQPVYAFRLAYEVIYPPAAESSRTAPQEPPKELTTGSAPLEPPRGPISVDTLPEAATLGIVPANGADEGDEGNEGSIWPDATVPPAATATSRRQVLPGRRLPPSRDAAASHTIVLADTSSQRRPS